MNYRYRVDIIDDQGKRTKYAESRDLSAAEAVFAATSVYGRSALELRYLDPAYTKYEVLARKGELKLKGD